MQQKTKADGLPDHHNRLINEKSPYLLQHAENPVDWYPWSDEAFEKARKDDKPIFLSIGYSTCHWCHVMEHESFEDDTVARLMNESFVCIKVDREERPDIDNIYMTVCQMLTGSGGWPLTIIMTPDKKPFYAATYIPRQSRFGQIGMMDLMPRLAEIWKTRRKEVLDSAEQVVQELGRAFETDSGSQLGEPILNSAFEYFSQNYDSRFGGFGREPKFPTPHNFLFLLRYWNRTREPLALEMVENTLKAMRRGGIYDHIGLGFHRYSTDMQWLVPHFEKMLYDQALLAMAYIETFQVTKNSFYSDTAREIFSYVLRDMTAQSGGFYSAEDADSEGIEGKFYIWKESEIRKILPKEDADLATTAYEIIVDGNFEGPAIGQRGDENILHMTKSVPELAAELNIPEDEISKRLEKVRKKLFKVREKRAHPHKDDKILTDWNGLMIAALARGARALDEPKYIDAAVKAANFILGTLLDDNKRLLHRFREGEAAVAAHIDDYAFMIWGLLELYESTFDARYLDEALRLNDEMIDRYWDNQEGGFFFTANDAEELPVRQKEVYDSAIPSGNSVAALNLLRLGRMTGNISYERKASFIFSIFANQVRRSPQGFTMLLTALDFAIGPSYEIAIVGRSDGKDTRKMLQALRSRFIPNKVLVLKPVNGESSEIEKLVEFIKEYKTLDGKATAYVCQEYICNLPTNDINQMLKELKAEE